MNAKLSRRPPWLDSRVYVLISSMLVAPEAIPGYRRVALRQSTESITSRERSYSPSGLYHYVRADLTEEFYVWHVAWNDLRWCFLEPERKWAAELFNEARSTYFEWLDGEELWTKELTWTYLKERT